MMYFCKLTREENSVFLVQIIKIKPSKGKAIGELETACPSRMCQQ
jgi:hypothetical protein